MRQLKDFLWTLLTYGLPLNSVLSGIIERVLVQLIDFEMNTSESFTDFQTIQTKNNLKYMLSNTNISGYWAFYNDCVSLKVMPNKFGELFITLEANKVCSKSKLAAINSVQFELNEPVTNSLCATKPVQKSRLHSFSKNLELPEFLSVFFCWNILFQLFYLYCINIKTSFNNFFQNTFGLHE